jgi:N-acetylglucosaminyl-diphospho-decaprenol L-rhamnosyltransferase
MITVSVVSHGHGAIVEELVMALSKLPEVSRIIVTHNIPELTTIGFSNKVEVIDNPVPKGFGVNHNAAFGLCKDEFFCVINPDICLPENPFPVLLDTLIKRDSAVVAPAALSLDGNIEDSARRFPTPLGLFIKFLGLDDGRYLYSVGDEVFAADWVGGMFMLFRADDFKLVSGFDEKFFLYYEDVDICARLWKARRSVLVCPQVQVIHNARRASRRDLRHMLWHLASMMRYFSRHLGRLPVVKTKEGQGA